jgi:hypothetical protein
MVDISECVKFTDYLELSKVVTDKVGFLTTVFKRLHSNIPADDLVNTGGRIAKMWVTCHKDTGYLLEIIWVSAARPCNGSHLNYMQGMINSKFKQNVKPPPQVKLKRNN